MHATAARADADNAPLSPIVEDRPLCARRRSPPLDLIVPIVPPIAMKCRYFVIRALLRIMFREANSDAIENIIDRHRQLP